MCPVEDDDAQQLRGQRQLRLEQRHQRIGVMLLVGFEAAALENLAYVEEGRRAVRVFAVPVFIFMRERGAGADEEWDFINVRATDAMPANRGER